MNAQEIIEAYVNDVAVELPRGQRDDVAFELRALLGEELQGRAEAVGREPDAAMATELLAAFGRPAEVAGRYRPTLTIIDPADGHAFLRAALIGLVVIWGSGLVAQFSHPIGSVTQFLGELGQWWGRTLVASMWWPGVLVIGFAISSWIRRNSPRAAEWTPRPVDRISGGRPALAMALIGILCGAFLLLDPTWILDFFWDGRAAPAAYQALSYADPFRHRQGPLLLVLILLNVPLLIAVLREGRWTARLRRLSDLLALTTCTAMLWTVLEGPVLLAAASDRFAKFAMVIIIGISLLDLGIKWFRRVSAAPARGRG
jgi:hypothetical protein